MRKKKIDEKEEYTSILVSRLEEAFKRGGFDFTFLNSREEALNFLSSEIPKNSSIGYGGSRTLEEVGILDYFRKNSYEGLLDRAQAKSPEEKEEIQRKIFFSDIFLTSTNALTADAKLINIDKTGNRVAALVYGPKKVFVVCGMNKLCDNLEEGMLRTSKAAVLNAIRFNTKTPCRISLKCEKCVSADRLCVSTVITECCFPKGRIHIVLIDEELGF